MEAEICGRWSEGRPTPSPEHNGCHNEGAQRTVLLCRWKGPVLSCFMKTSPLSPVAQVTSTKKSSEAPDATKDQVTRRSTEQESAARLLSNRLPPFVSHLLFNIPHRQITTRVFLTVIRNVANFGL